MPTDPVGASSRQDRRALIGAADVPDAVAAVQAHAIRGIVKRRGLGLPTCGDAVHDTLKLTAIMEELGEVGRVFQDAEGPARLRSELLDLATCATLWAWALDQEHGLSPIHDEGQGSE